MGIRSRYKLWPEAFMAVILVVTHQTAHTEQGREKHSDRNGQGHNVGQVKEVIVYDIGRAHVAVNELIHHLDRVDENKDDYKRKYGIQKEDK